MEKVIRAVLEYGSPKHLANDLEAFTSLKEILALEKMPATDHDAVSLLINLSGLYQKHIDHYWLLTDLMLDLKTTSQLYFINLKLTEQPDSEGRKLDLTSHNRTYLILAVIHFSKLNEIIDSYGKDKQDLTDTNLVEKTNKLNATIQKSSIYKYRSNYIAHSFVKENGTSYALYFKEGIELIRKIIGCFIGKDLTKSASQTDINIFFDKIYNNTEESIVHLVHNFKEAIRSEKLHRYEINR